MSMQYLNNIGSNSLLISNSHLNLTGQPVLVVGLLHFDLLSAKLVMLLRDKCQIQSCHRRNV